MDFEAETIRLEGGRSKNREARTFPFSTYPPLADLLREQRAHTSTVERAKGRIVAHVFHRDGDENLSMRGAWKTESIYRRYAIADHAAMLDGVSKLARLHESEPKDRDVVPLEAGHATVTPQSEATGT